MTSLDRTTDAGFVYAMDATAARRQLTLSVTVVIGLAVAIVAAAVSVPKLSVQAPSFYTVSIPSTTMQADRERLPAARS